MQESQGGISAGEAVAQVSSAVVQAMNGYSFKTANATASPLSHGIGIAADITSVVLQVLSPGHPVIRMANTLWIGLREFTSPKQTGQ